MRTVLLISIASVAITGAQTAGLNSAPSENSVLNEVLVTGQQPGPSLWKVTKDNSTLWILGTYEPLPTSITWRSGETETTISKSQVLVRWVNIETDLEVGMFARLAALPALSKLGNNPNDTELKDVLPPETYRQWQSEKTKHISNDTRLEKLRPAFAIAQLKEMAMKKMGLSPEAEPVIWPTLLRIAKKHRIKTIEPEVRMKIKIDNPRALIQRFRDTHLADLECFTQSLNTLDSDLQEMKSRANAWATGDMNVLRHIPPPDPKADCVRMIQSLLFNGQLAAEMNVGEQSKHAQDAIENVLKESAEKWLATIETAMSQNSSVFAVVPLSNLLDAKGPLQSLREHGYQVNEP